MKPQLDFSPDHTPAAWLDMARQLTSAWLFLDEHTPVVHLDIKPDNIFYHTLDAPRQRFHYWLGDFGICAVDGARQLCDEAALRLGSVQYMPPSSHASMTKWLRKGSLRELSLFQYFATLADMVRLPPSDTSGRRPHFLSDGAHSTPVVAQRLERERPPQMPPPLSICTHALLECEPHELPAQFKALHALLFAVVEPQQRPASVASAASTEAAAADALPNKQRPKTGARLMDYLLAVHRRHGRY
jgi:serine/threonine protein kinase